MKMCRRRRSSATIRARRSPNLTPVSAGSTLQEILPMTRLSFVIAAACLAVPAGVRAQRPSPIPEAELVRRMGAALDSLAAAGEFSGVVVLARAGQPVFQHAYGLADRAARRANTVETAVNLGSINK